MMRDPARIDRVLKVLSQYWHDNSDMRLAQIVGNCHGAGDPYHMEDDHFEDWLRQLNAKPK